MNNNTNCRLCHYYDDVDQNQGYCNRYNHIIIHNIEYLLERKCESFVKFTDSYRENYLNNGDD